tara:strand:- start:13375 stop:14265 length:891 start_codon:yes stop_codon:yes gene_type:complete
MKRVTFKKEFTNINEALTKVPNQLKEDNNTFEMTDGNKVIKVRWEGTLTEGRAIALNAKDELLINEEVSKMKNLMGYKSEDTIGTHKANGRVMENDKFKELLSTSKKKTLTENSGNVALIDETEILDEGLKSIMAGVMMLIGAISSGQEVSPQKVDSVKTELSRLSPEQKTVIGDKLTPEQKEQIKSKTGVEFTDEYMDDTFAWEPNKDAFKHEAASKLDLGKYKDIKAAKVINIGSNGHGGHVYTVQISGPYASGTAFTNVRSYLGKKNQKLGNTTIKFVNDTGSPYGGKDISYK